MARAQYDVVVVGAGPNGLSAAIELARAGLSVRVFEGGPTPGGGCRSGELTEPGFIHDHCAAVHPLGAGSPVFRALKLEQYGLQWIESPALLAHVVGDGEVLTLERTVADAAVRFGRDAGAYRDLVTPFVERFDDLYKMVLGPLRLPSHPILMGRFGLQALRSMRGLGGLFEQESVRALMAGMAAHAMVPLDAPGTASFALVLAIAGHAVGWPIARGGSQAIIDALVACLQAHGGELELGRTISRLDELPTARAYVLDVTPRQLLKTAGDRLPATYRHRLEKYEYGPGVFKMDWALSAPIPWSDPNCARASTVHMSGNFADIAASVDAVNNLGKLSDRPFVLLAQPSLFDPTRAPPGKHTAWAYCHVPHGSTLDASAEIEAHIERYAPGFRETIVARASKNAVEMERYNPNYVGGDINGGLARLSQLFFRPVARVDPYATPAPDIFLCSSSTPPGGGVHGMCGHWSARSVLRHVFGR